MNTEKEELFFQKRLLESAQLAFQKGITVYTDFLGLAEQNLFYGNIRELPPIAYSVYGGTENAERYCICFDGMEPVTATRQIPVTDKESFPISCIRITPSGLKYSETLTHRDYLGALMHLGITRAKLGDIFIREKTAYVFCTEQIADFICKELFQIKHTSVHCEVVIPEEELLSPTFQTISGTVASLRLDAFIALAFQTSRSSMTEYIDGGKTYINGRLSTKQGEQLEEGDIVSVRGKGRFLVDQIKNQTKKGRIAVEIKKYIS